MSHHAEHTQDHEHDHVRAHRHGAHGHSHGLVDPSIVRSRAGVKTVTVSLAVLAEALAIGARLSGGYQLAVSSGAQRATQTLACFLAVLRQRVPGGVVVEPGLRSQLEDRWRAAYQEAGSGELDALRDADAELVAEDSQRLGNALRRILDSLPESGSVLVVGHSPTNEAAVLGLTGEIVAPLAKGAGVRVVANDDGWQVEPLD